MSYRLLDLDFAQLNTAWKKSKFNSYSDKKKTDYHNRIEAIINLLLKEDFGTLSISEISERRIIIDFCFKSLEFLDNSILNLLPFEIVECLSGALKEWIDVNDDFIIVTSFAKGIHDFSFDPYLGINDKLYQLIELKYSIQFPTRLIQINVPAFLSRDYLANVVLYHELGHFIDLKLGISERLYYDILNQYFSAGNAAQKKEIERYFPYLPSIGQTQFNTWYRQGQLHIPLLDHIGEYFCDLFAAQYVEECANYYLGHITDMRKDYSDTHPSTTNRVELVNRFIKNDPDCFVSSLILQATEKISGRELKRRYEVFPEDDIIRLLPVDISNEKQLHYLFIAGWNLWLNGTAKFKEANDMQFNPSTSLIYDIVNNLIEKSVGNYVVKRDWDNAKMHVS